MSHELLHTMPLFRDRILLVASPDTPWARRPVVEPQDLGNMPMIAYERVSKFRAYVDASFQAAGFTPDVIMEFDSHEAVKAMVTAGFGVAMMPSSPWPPTSKRKPGRADHRGLRGAGPHHVVSIIRRGPHQSPPVRAFLDLVRETFPPGTAY